MEQCSEADMALDQRDLKYIITSPMKQADQDDFSNILLRLKCSRQDQRDLKNILRGVGLH